MNLPNLREWIVVDLDGTLANSKHREHYAQAGDWEAFHSLLGEDLPNKDVDEAVRALELAGFEFLIITGRPAIYRRATLDWFTKHGMTIGTYLLMRPDEDWRSDTEVKPSLISGFFGSIEKARDSVLFVLEDRDKMVERWRELGFRCWQVAPGGY